MKEHDEQTGGLRLLSGQDGETTQRRIRRFFAVATIALIVVALSFTGALNITSFKQNYTKSLISSFSVLGGETVRKIEYAVKYGKPLENFYGMEELLGKLVGDSDNIRQVQIIRPGGEIVYDEQGQVSGRALGEQLRAAADFSQNAEAYTSLLEEGEYHVFMPIRDKDGVWIGTLGLAFGENVVKSQTDPYLYRLIAFLLGLAFVSAVLLILFASRVEIVTKEGQIRKRRLLTVILLVLGLVQFVFGSVNYVLLKDGFLASVKENTSMVIRIIERDVKFVVDKGVPYSKMYGVGEYMDRIIDAVPEIDRISILNSDFTTEKVKPETRESKYTYTLPLVRDQAQGSTYLTVVDLSQRVIDGKMRDILLDTLTMVIISFVVMVEITLFVLLYMKKRLAAAPSAAGEANDTGADRTMIRPLAFLIFASVYMSTAFIPVLMKKLYEPLFGLSETVVLGLPISAEMLFLAVSSLLAGAVIDRRGWKPAFLIGAVTIAAGTLLSAFGTTALLFIASRAVVGTGFGFALMAMQAYVVTAPTEEAKNEGLTELNSGAYAGMNCGIVVGAILLDRTSFSFVFLVATVVIVFGALFALRWMGNIRRERSDETASAEVSPEAAVPGGGSLKRFLLNREIVQMFLLVLIPISICGMFLGYFFPVYAESIGVTPSDVGRVFLLNGLCIVFLGPILSPLSEKFLGTRGSFIASNLLVVVALIIFASYASLFTAIAAVVMLGIAEGVGITSQINYYIGRKAALDIGEGKAMGIYSLMENVGQTLGPIVFGLVAAFGSGGVGAIGAGMLGMLFMFVLLSGRIRRPRASHAVEGEM